jgi:hypothetical protein
VILPSKERRSHVKNRCKVGGGPPALHSRAKIRERGRLARFVELVQSCSQTIAIRQKNDQNPNTSDLRINALLSATWHDSIPAQSAAPSRFPVAVRDFPARTAHSGSRARHDKGGRHGAAVVVYCRKNDNCCFYDNEQQRHDL